MVTEKQFAQAKRKYNEIMNLLCCEHLTIGEYLSEGTENWNLRRGHCSVDDNGIEGK